MEIEDRYKSSSFGVASNIILGVAILIATLYELLTIKLTPDGKYSSFAQAEVVFYTIFEILLVCGLISLGCAIMSLVLKEKKLFPFVTIGFIIGSPAILMLWIIIETSLR